MKSSEGDDFEYGGICRQRHSLAHPAVSAPGSANFGAGLQWLRLAGDLDGGGKPLPADVARGFTFPYNNWANRIATHRFVKDIPTGIGNQPAPPLAAIESQLPLLQSKSG